MQKAPGKKKTTRKPKAAPAQKSASSAEITGDDIRRIMNLNPATARGAIVLSEIIGPPVSKRQGRP